MESNGSFKKHIVTGMLEECCRNGFEFGQGRVGAVEAELDNMSFPDELFGDEQMKPLKLPPRLLIGSELSSPSPSRSTSRGLKHAFQQMWLEDSDPFQKAVEKIREGDKWGKRRGSRRSGFVSHLGVHQWTINDLNMSRDFIHNEQGPDSCVWSQTQVNPMMIEPRGLSIARKLRPLSMDQGKDTIMQVQKPSSPAKESKHRLEGPLSRRFELTGEWSGRQGSKKCSGNATEIELNQREIKTVVQYKSRPKMLLCLGFQKAC